MKKFALLLLTFLIPSMLPAQEIPVAPDSARRPKIALVLSGGAALGFAHLGFLKVLEEVGIPIDCIVGNSMGSIIGGMYAAGYSPGDIERLSVESNWAEVFLNEGASRYPAVPGDPAPLLRLNFNKSGVGKSKGVLPDQNLTLLLSRLLYRVSMYRDFAALSIPFKTIAVDIADGKEVPLDHGALYRAMRASMSIPVVFPPVPMDGAYLIDGAFINNNPIDMAREWGADIIIDVDVGSLVAKKPKEIDSIDKVVDQTIRLLQTTSYGSNLAVGDEDFRLVMDLSGFYLTDFAKAQTIIDCGEEITRSSKNMLALLKLAAKIETKRPLDKRDWRRKGSYLELPEPVFTQVRLVSIGANGAEESRQTTASKISPRSLNSLFDNFFGKNVDSGKLEETIELLRRRGNYESVGYHLEERADGGYCLVLTGVKATERKNDVALTLMGALSFGNTTEFGVTARVNFNFNDLLLRDSRLNLNASFTGSRMGGASLSLGYTKGLSSLFQARAEVTGDYLTSSIFAFQPEGKLSTLGGLKGRAQFFYTPVDYFNLSLGYLYEPFWYQNKGYNTATQSVVNMDLSSGDMHSVEVGLHYNTGNIDQLLRFSFLHNITIDATANFPFAGSRLRDGPVVPYYERFDVLLQKAWTPHIRRSFTADLNIGSYRGEMASEWSFYTPSGKTGIPGYAGIGVLGRDKGVVGLTYLEEIPPLSRILSVRTFFALTLRGGYVWEEFTGIERFKEPRGGVRAGLQLQTPIGALLFGPEVSFDGKFQFSIYFN
ncbi:hypothetical protein AGMMS49942_09920 [Spirochaetia bacterium]|nr:hypothetical protein AGMMS49942_09920 [Spirochaetia bacterium]